MTDTSKQEELIEEAAKAIWIERNASDDTGWGEMAWAEITMPDDWNQEALDALNEARAALAVFEQAHTPTSDEREALGAVAKSAYSAHREANPGRTWADEAAGQTGAWEAAATAVAVALRRTAVQEPNDDGHDGWCGCEKCEPKPQGEPDIAESFLAVAEGLGLSPDVRQQALDQLAEAGQRVDRAQDEPTDAQVLAALNSLNEYEPPPTDINRLPDSIVEEMRAALRAAAEVRGEGDVDMDV